MKRVSRAVLKLLIFIMIFLIVGWFGLKYYFNHINEIDDRIRNDVAVSIQQRESLFLNYDDIPEIYRNAVIATEDRSFFTNKGIDLKGIIRAIYVNIAEGELQQGGSTITQQLIDNTILSGMSKSLKWKLSEGIYAIGVYDTMNKEETFAYYANVIYFGHGAYGLYQAADIYFGKTPAELSSGEMTLLAGLPNAPSVYDPYKNMELARERQKHVIQSMVDSEIISEAQAEQILDEPITLKGDV